MTCHGGRCIDQCYGKRVSRMVTFSAVVKVALAEEAAFTQITCETLRPQASATASACRPWRRSRQSSRRP